MEPRQFMDQKGKKHYSQHHKHVELSREDKIFVNNIIWKLTD